MEYEYNDKAIIQNNKKWIALLGAAISLGTALICLDDDLVDRRSKFRINMQVNAVYNLIVFWYHLLTYLKQASVQHSEWVDRMR